MEGGDLWLQVLSGTFLAVGICMLGYCLRRTRKQPTMKSSPSMEELNGVVTEDPST